MFPRRDDREYGPWLDRFAGFLQPGLTALELGCGLGDDARLLAIRGLRVIGLDRDPARVGEAARRVPEAGFVVADLTATLPFRDAVVDLVVASLSLHYFNHRTTAAIVGEVRRVLREDGRLLARVNAVGDRQSAYGVGIELEPDVFEVEPGHVKRFYTPASLRELLEPAFTIETLVEEETISRYQDTKQTLVVRARRTPR